jgi:hypothetical protein
MEKIMPTATTIGLLIGVCLFGAILFFINKSRTNNGIEKVYAYIANCEMIPLKINDFTIDDGNVIGFFTRRGSKDYSTEEAIFYDSIYKKYFSLKFIGNSQNRVAFDAFLTRHLNKGEEIDATVNKIEMADTNYGTQQKPVPVFNFERSPDKSWNNFFEFAIGSDTTNAIKKKEQIYYDAIAIYLTFVKSKKDFKKMFPDK